MENIVRVGVGVIVRRNGKVLVGKRLADLGKGTWSVPGGHLEYSETFEDCAKRETHEEAGILIKNVKIGAFTNDIFHESGKHYITIFMVSDYDKGKVQVMEPDKMIKWGWFEWSKLPKPLFLPTVNLLEQNFNPFR